MAVHLNARLKTRYIPMFLALAALIGVFGSHARASAGADPGAGRADALDESPAPGEAPSAVGARDAGELRDAAEAQLADGGVTVPREELEAVMSEGTDPARRDRRPGFSRIIVAPRPGERPSTGRELVDSVSVQPPEAAPDQR